MEKKALSYNLSFGKLKMDRLGTLSAIARHGNI